MVSGESMSEKLLRAKLIRLAASNPSLRADLLPLLKAGGFPASSLGEDVPGPEGVPGSDAGKPWAKGQFTQEQFRELEEKQVRHDLDDGKADPVKAASDQALRAKVIRLAHEHPNFRTRLIPILKPA